MVSWYVSAFQVCICVHQAVWRGERHGWNVKERGADLGNHGHDKDMPVIELLKMFR